MTSQNSPSSETPIPDGIRHFKKLAIASWNPEMTEDQLQAEYDRQESVRLRDALQSLSSPLYRARAERLGMTEYLRQFSTGAVR